MYVFDQHTDLLTMMDATIVHDEYAAGTRIQVGEWHL